MIPNSEFLKEIVRRGSILSLKQPIISMKEKRIVGYEALSRGIDLTSGELIPPDVLFGSAQKWGMSHELDKACMKKALYDFSRQTWNDKQILFLNFDPATLNRLDISPEWVRAKKNQYGIAPSSVAIEIVESKVKSHDSLKKFVHIFRDLGFLIVLDDFGSEHSNFNRVLQVKPDIIKIDRELVDNISREFYKRAIVETIITLSSKIGALSLVEGVENMDDIMVCHELGADLFQGFYFAKPVQEIEEIAKTCRSKIDDLFMIAGRRQKQNISGRHSLKLKYEDIVVNFCNALSEVSMNGFDRVLAILTEDSETVECAYILNIDGIQVSETHCVREVLNRKKSSLFMPSSKGTDHSLKSYYPIIKGLRYNDFFSDPYISLATGNLCRTMSRVFTNRDNEKFIICVDFKDADV